MNTINISTFAVALTGNKGAASMLESIIDNFTNEIPNVEFNVFSVYPKADRKVNIYQNVKIRNGSPAALILYLIPLSLLLSILKRLRISISEKLLVTPIKVLLHSDLILEVGGTTFTDAQLLKVIYNVACILPPVLLNKKTMMYSQTVGPFNSFFNRTLAKATLQHIAIAVGRGRQSTNHLLSLGLKNAEYCADGAFTMNYHKGVEEKISSTCKPLIEEGKIIVGISPNSIVERICYKHNIDHARIFGEFINYLNDRNYKVLLIPHSLRRNFIFKRHNNDSYTISDILRYVSNPDDLVVVKEDYNSEELRMLIKQTDFYITSRFHAMISAICVGVPVMVIHWGYHKYAEVLDEFYLADYAFPAAKINIETLIYKFERMVEDEVIIKNKIYDKLPEIMESSRRNLYLAKNLIGLD